MRNADDDCETYTNPIEIQSCWSSIFRLEYLQATTFSHLVAPEFALMCNENSRTFVIDSRKQILSGFEAGRLGISCVAMGGFTSRLHYQTKQRENKHNKHNKPNKHTIISLHVDHSKAPANSVKRWKKYFKKESIYISMWMDCLGMNRRVEDRQKTLDYFTDSIFCSKKNPKFHVCQRIC